MLKRSNFSPESFGAKSFLFEKQVQPLNIKIYYQTFGQKSKFYNKILNFKPRNSARKW